jgi:hypothetical protein
LASALGFAGLTLLAALALAVSLMVVQTRALSDLKAEQKKTTDALYDSQMQSAKLALEQGLMVCERGDEDRGMLWLAHALELTPAQEADLRHAILLNLGAWRHRLPFLKAILPHGDQIQAVALSPQGQVALTAGLDRAGRR